MLPRTVVISNELNRGDAGWAGVDQCFGSVGGGRVGGLRMRRGFSV